MICLEAHLQVCQEQSLPDCDAKLLLIMEQKRHSVKAKRGKSVNGLWLAPPQVCQEESLLDCDAELLLFVEQESHIAAHHVENNSL